MNKKIIMMSILSILVIATVELTNMFINTKDWPLQIRLIVSVIGILISSQFVFNENDYLEKFLNAMTLITFLAVITVVLIQVITRFTDTSFSWTEEASRMFFVASIFFAAPIAYKKFEFVIVDVLVNIFPAKLKNIIELLTNLLIIALFFVLLKFGIDMTVKGLTENSPTLGIKMALPYFLIPFSSMCFLYYIINNTINSFKNVIKKEV